MGATLGVQASAFILGVLGLKSIADYVVDGFPRIIEYYVHGIKTAWQGPREQGLNPFINDDPYAQNRAIKDIAQGHVEVVVLLLGAMVEYLTRGRGDARLLAQEMRTSAKGERLGQWMLEHEDALKKRPDLQRPEPRRSPFDTQEPTPNNQSGKDQEHSKGKPNSMPRHEVECFKADRMHASKIGEFERQLKGQEGGLNRLTVDEFLENIANPIKRSSAAASKARAAMEAQLQRRFQGEFSQTMDVLDAEEAAIKKPRRQCRVLQVCTIQI